MNVRKHSRTFASIRKQSQTFSNVRKNSRTFCNVRKRSQKFVNVRKQTRTFANIPERLQTFANFQKHSQTFANIRKRSQTFANVRKLSQTIANVANTAPYLAQLVVVLLWKLSTSPSSWIKWVSPVGYPTPRNTEMGFREEFFRKQTVSLIDVRWQTNSCRRHRVLGSFSRVFWHSHRFFRPWLPDLLLRW